MQFILNICYHEFLKKNEKKNPIFFVLAGEHFRNRVHFTTFYRIRQLQGKVMIMFPRKFKCRLQNPKQNI